MSPLDDMNVLLLKTKCSERKVEGAITIEKSQGTFKTFHITFVIGYI